MPNFRRISKFCKEKEFLTTTSNQTTATEPTFRAIFGILEIREGGKGNFRQKTASFLEIRASTCTSTAACSDRDLHRVIYHKCSYSPQSPAAKFTPPCRWATPTKAARNRAQISRTKTKITKSQDRTNTKTPPLLRRTSLPRWRKIHERWWNSPRRADGIAPQTSEIPHDFFLRLNSDNHRAGGMPQLAPQINVEYIFSDERKGKKTHSKLYPKLTRGVEGEGGTHVERLSYPKRI